MTCDECGCAANPGELCAECCGTDGDGPCCGEAYEPGNTVRWLCDECWHAEGLGCAGGCESPFHAGAATGGEP